MQRTTDAAEALKVVVVEVVVVMVVVTTLPTPKAVSSTAERCVVDVVVVPLFTVCLQVDEADFRGRA